MSSTSPGISLIVGLGNIGTEYEGSRHNCGFEFADKLAARCGAFFHEEKKFSSFVTRITLGRKDVWLIKPTTYMNCSGTAVQAVSQYYRIPAGEILVVHDELDLPPGIAKLKHGGGNAGHNGLKDICQKMGTPDFWRLRIGIGHPRTLGLAQPVVDFVLHSPSREHRLLIEQSMSAPLEYAESFADGNFQKIQKQIAQAETPDKADTRD